MTSKIRFLTLYRSLWDRKTLVHAEKLHLQGCCSLRSLPLILSVYLLRHMSNPDDSQHSTLWHPEAVAPLMRYAGKILSGLQLASLREK